MSNIKPSSHGIVVEHKENGMRFALSDQNYNPEVHRKVRDLRPGESVRTYRPRSAEALSSAVEDSQDPGTPAKGDRPSQVGSSDAQKDLSGESPKA